VSHSAGRRRRTSDKKLYCPIESEKKMFYNTDTSCLVSFDGDDSREDACFSSEKRILSAVARPVICNVPRDLNVCRDGLPSISLVLDPRTPRADKSSV